MRLQDIELQSKNYPSSFELSKGENSRVYTLFLRVTGTIVLPYQPIETRVWIGKYPMSETGSDISVESLGDKDGYLVMCDTFGLYPMVIVHDENMKTVKEACELLSPELETEAGRISIPDAQIILGSCNLVDFDSGRSLTLIRDAQSSDTF